MDVIRPQCRTRMTAEDIDFIVSILGERQNAPSVLKCLLADDHSRDIILDDDRLLVAILEERNCVSISNHFYFYVLVRHALQEAGMEDREVADYVASLLAAFCSTHRARRPCSSTKDPVDYVVDMLKAYEQADDKMRFLIRAHVGNHSLFLTGVFPKFIRCRRERRAAPGLRYYEEIGRMNFKAASGHRLARTLDLADVFRTLSDTFTTTRLALNNLAERMIVLDALPDVDAWCTR